MTIIMEPLARHIHKLLIRKKKTVGVAESCTGGLLSKTLTDSPGSSKYFLLGLVTYNKNAKKNILGITDMAALKEGAVCAEAAIQMASSVRKISHSDFGIGITGVAGPGRGLSKIPVGTVFIAVTGRGARICREFHFKGSRPEVRKKAALAALQLLKSQIV